MKTMSRVLASLLICSLCCAAVYADNAPGHFTFTLGNSYIDFSSKRHINNANAPFGALGFTLTPHVDIEGLLGFFTTRSHLPVDEDRSITGSLFTLDVIYRFSPYRCIVPYLLAGPGFLSMHPNGTNPDTEGNINGGAGVDLLISNQIAFRVEARDMYTINGGKQDILLNGGVSILF
jgi:hypothetical protein